MTIRRVAVVAVALALTACSADAVDDATTRDTADGAEARTETTGAATAGPVDAVVDVDCTQAALSGDDDSFAFAVAYPVVDGELAGPCLGPELESDAATLLDAWESLETITPPAQLADLGVFAGFVPDGAAEADTLAFVNALDVDGAQFQMSVNLDAAVENPDELLLTLAHEFSHVFTATPSQLDRTAESIDDCGTYDNGEGCYLDGALVWLWIEQFWPPDVLADVDPDGDGDDDIDARCAGDSGFFGSYAATDPEEDFAEAFSAFVFGLEPVTPGQADRLAWIADQPGLAEFRDRADSAGLTPLDNTFDECGV